MLINDLYRAIESNQGQNISWHCKAAGFSKTKLFSMLDELGDQVFKQRHARCLKIFTTKYAEENNLDPSPYLKLTALARTSNGRQAEPGEIEVIDRCRLIDRLMRNTGAI